MTLSIDQIRPAGRSEWDAVWARCSVATYFHGPDWADIWRTATNGRFRPAARTVVFSDGRIALLPESRQRLRGGLLHRRVSSPAGTFGGWIAPVPLDSVHAALLTAELLDTRRAIVLRVNPFDPTHAAIAGTGAESDAGLTDDGHPRETTHALDLRAGPEPIEQRWRRGSVARKERTAIRAGVEIRVAETEDDWRAYDALYRESLVRWGAHATSRYDWSLFDAIRRRGSGNEHLWLAVHRGRPVAGALCFESSFVTSYWHGAASADAFPLRAVNLLMCEIARNAAARGAAWFDLGPSGSHDGVAAFKRSLGATALPCPLLRRGRRAGRHPAPPAGSER